MPRSGNTKQSVQKNCSEHIMNFTDPQLQKCYEKEFVEACDVSAKLRQVRALIAAHDLFQMLEGPHSSRVHETIWHLLLPKLRPGLRRWYQRAGAEIDPATVEFRDYLSQLAGEKLETMTQIQNNPS